MMKTSAALLLVAHILSVQAAQELVMHDGASIEANKDGSLIKVVAGRGFDRSYELDGCKLKSNMSARHERWFGSLGIYDPAGSLGFSFFSSRECKGISRTVVQEGQIHFDDMHFADEWIRRQQRAAGKDGKVVWTTSGLLVAWRAVPGRAQMSVDVWLMCFRGQPFHRRDGATDNAVATLANPSGQAIHDCEKTGKEVVDQTRTQLEQHWKEIDDWTAADKVRRQRIKNIPAAYNSYRVWTTLASS
jgi:hypothetical protein